MSAPTTPWYASPAVLGVTRAVEPPGALPHIARVVDAAAPILPEEAEIAVEALNVDATSYRVIRERCDGDAGRMADCIAAIVRERGKLQNPWTGSGGILAGRVTAVGERHWDPDLRPGDRVVPLASLIAIPLELEAVGPLAPASPQVPVRGRAVVTGRMACARIPDDLPLGVVLTALDVYPAASHARAMAAPGDHVLVLGAGHAGLLAAVAAH
jgi:L-erythro-3,5-diaminohexanoate dehydrogenase